MSTDCRNHPHAGVNVRIVSVLSAGFLCAMLCTTVHADKPTLRVCADLNNLPFSNSRQEGFVNKLAESIARDLRRRVAYTWMPQRRSFFRLTLLAKECDVVMGVPTGFDGVTSTEPYYRSTYAFVYLRAKHLKINSFSYRVLKTRRIGIHAVGGAGVNTSAAQALAQHGLVRSIVGFPMWAEGNVDSPPGKTMETVAREDIDVAVVWGPFAGYFAKPYGDRLQVTPVRRGQGPMPFEYDISVGVRQDDTDLKQTLRDILDRKHNDIKAMLADYRIPTIDSDRTTAQR